MKSITQRIIRKIINVELKPNQCNSSEISIILVFLIVEFTNVPDN